MSAAYKTTKRREFIAVTPFGPGHANAITYVPGRPLQNVVGVELDGISQFDPWDNVVAGQNLIVYSDANGTHTIVVPPGNYTEAALAALIAAQSNAANPLNPWTVTTNAAGAGPNGRWNIQVTIGTTFLNVGNTTPLLPTLGWSAAQTAINFGVFPLGSYLADNINAVTHSGYILRSAALGAGRANSGSVDENGEHPALMWQFQRPPSVASAASDRVVIMAPLTDDNYCERYISPRYIDSIDIDFTSVDDYINRGVEAQPLTNGGNILVTLDFIIAETC